MNDTVLQNALRLRRAGKFAEAAQLYSELLRSDPRHFEALHALGILHYQSGQLEEAERLIGEAVVVNPKAADALYNRASLLLRPSPRRPRRPRRAPVAEARFPDCRWLRHNRA
jgi:tetratricopeptide (TPR) repeat protein